MPIEDLLALGTTVTLGSHTFGTDEIKKFARLYDPQRFHVDEAAVRHTIFGSLCASGWHTISVWMRKNVEFGPQGTRLAQGQQQALRFGPSPGLRHLNWLRPVYAGETITFTRTVTNCRTVPDKPGWYLVKNHCTAINQDGKKVMEFDSAVLIGT